VFGSPPADSAFLYKSYIVHQDRGRDILCDPYIVKKNDYVLKLFKQKGEIAHKDFPEFLRIFKRINPHIHNGFLSGSIPISTTSTPFVRTSISSSL